MGGKSSTSTQQVTIPPEVLARYNAIMDKSGEIAGHGFQQYSTNPNAFVEQINPEQMMGINATNQYAQSAQPYYQQANSTLGNAYANAQPLNRMAEYGTANSAQTLSPNQINQFYSPYMQNVASSTEALVNQQNQQAMAGQMGNAINQGAFGGDRAGIAAANLNQQQMMAGANIYAGLQNAGYNNALSAAQQQQQIGLQGARQLADIGNLQYQQGANTAQEYGALGTGAQSSALQGAQAQIGAGTLQQQTGQAGKSALYNQFEQQQAFPFQVQQWLANMALGMGTATGSTTTTTQPGGFGSDERLKEDIRPIGKTFDGQTIHQYKYKDDPRTQIGLIAQEVEHHHPDAVGLAGGYKTVDYGKATDHSADRGHFYSGGLVPNSMGGHVHLESQGENFAYGGSPTVPGITPSDMAAILQSQQGMYAPFAQSGLYGAKGGSDPYGAPAGHVPSATIPVSHLAVAGPLTKQPTTLETMQGVAGLGSAGTNIWKNIEEAKAAEAKKIANTPPPVITKQDDNLEGTDRAARGGVIGKNYASGGMPYQNSSDPTGGVAPAAAPSPAKLDIPDSPMQDNSSLKTAGSLPNKPSALQNASSVAGIAGTGLQAAKAAGLLGSAAGAAGTAGAIGGLGAGMGAVGAGAAGASELLPLLMLASRGGVAGGRHGYAGGGNPSDGFSFDFDPNHNYFQDAIEKPKTILDTPAAATKTILDTPAAATETSLAGDTTEAMLRRAAANRARTGLAGASLETAGTGAGAEAGAVAGAGAGESTGLLAGGSEGLGARILNLAPRTLGAIGTVGKYAASAPAQGALLMAHSPDTVSQTEEEKVLSKYRSPQHNLNKDGSQIIPTKTPTVAPKHNVVKTAGVAPSPSVSTNDPTNGVGAFSPQVAEGQPTTVEGLGATNKVANTPAMESGATLADATKMPVASAPSTDKAGSATTPNAATAALKVAAAAKAKEPSKSGESSYHWWTDPSIMVPAASGIAGFLTAPTRSLGVALGSGLGAAAQSYLPSQEALASVQKAQQETELYRQQAKQVGITSLAELNSMAKIGGYILQPDPNGKYKTPDGSTYSLVPKTSMISRQPSTTPATPQTSGITDANGAQVPIAQPTTAQPKYIGRNGMDMIVGPNGDNIASTNYLTVADANPDVAKASQELIEKTKQDAASARTDLQNTSRWESSIGANLSGPLKPGALQPLRQTAINTYNSVIDTFITDPEKAKQLYFNPEGLTQAQIAEKLSTGTAALAEAGAGQRSFGALKAFLMSTPNQSMNREAALNLIADMHMHNQMRIDKANYLDEIESENVKRGGLPRSYLASDAIGAFGKDHNALSYESERNQIYRLISDPRYPRINAILQGTDENKRQQMLKYIDHAYSPNLSRYFTGGV